MAQKSIESFATKKLKSKPRKRSKKGTSSPSTGDKHDIPYLEEKLKMYREIGHLEGIIDTNMEISQLHAKKNAFIPALEYVRKAVEKAGELQDEREASTFLLMGDIRFLTNDHDSAEDAWVQVDQCQEADDGHKLGAYLRLALLYRDASSTEMEDWLHLADSLAQTSAASIIRATRSLSLRSYDEAERLVRSAFTTLGINLHPMEFSGLTVLPAIDERSMYTLLGDIRKQAGNLRDASEAYGQAGDFLAQGDTLMEFGNIEQALIAFKKGFKKTSDGVYIIKQAEALIKMGEENSALSILRSGERNLEKKDPELFLRSLQIQLVAMEQAGDLVEVARLLEKKGMTFQSLKQYEAMNETMTKAVDLLVSQGDDDSWKRAVQILRNLIDSHSERKRFQEELDHRLKLEAIHLMREKPTKRIYEENIEYCYSLRRPELTIPFMQKEMVLHRGKETDYLDYLHLGRIYLSAGKHREGIAVHTEALKWYTEPKLKGSILRELGYLYRVTGQIERSLKSLNKSISSCKRAKDKEGRIKAITEIEKVYDDEIARENIIRSKGLSAMNKLRSRIEKLTSQANDNQKIIRETTKLVEEKDKKLQELHTMLDGLRNEVSANGKPNKSQMAMMDKLRQNITKQEDIKGSLERTVRENQTEKLKAQEEKTDLKQEIADLMKEDRKMKKKIEGIDQLGAKYRDEAMKLDPMLSTSAKLETIEEDIYHQLSTGSIPQIRIPTRTKDNIEFSEVDRVYKYSSGLSFRSAKSTDGANMLMRTAYVIDFIDDMIRTSMKGKNRSSTLRELYYISESWGKLAKFGTQNESNNLIEDLEIITRYLRENFHLRPEEDGARVIGNVTLREKNRKGEWKTINCREDVGDSGYSIPYNAEKEKLTFKNADADFVIAIETGGMFDRLVENGFDEDARAVLVHIKGQPARSTRRFLKRMNEETRLPVLVFTDGDPWSYRIFASIAYGAIKTAHISHHLATPSAEYIGITPSDILSYELPTDKLSDRDVEALNSELTDPRFADSFWQGEISTQLKIKKKSEQQALAKYGLDFVTDTYLPEKLGEMGYMR